MIFRRLIHTRERLTRISSEEREREREGRKFWKIYKLGWIDRAEGHLFFYVAFYAAVQVEGNVCMLQVIRGIVGYPEGICKSYFLVFTM